MKELSIEEKAKRYDEAISKLKGFMAQGVDPLITRADVQDFFPELKESEDERMIQYFKDLAPFDKADELYEKYGFSHKDALAWLEKQGEHANFLSKIQIGDKVTRNEDGVLVNLSQLKRVAKKDEKQGEQKSFAKYKVGDTIYYNSFGRLVNFVIANIVEDGTDNPMYEDKDGNPVFQNDIVEQKPADKVDVLMSLDEAIEHCKEKSCGNNACALEHKQLEKWLTELKELKEQKSAWSEEDEIELGDALWCCKQAASIAKDENDMGNCWYAEHWLKSLKERVQPKQEWSEEDEVKINRIVACLENLNVADNDILLKDVDWLKSLRPQNNITDEELAQAKKDAYNDALDKIEYHSGEPTFDDGWSAAIWYLKKKNAMPQTQWKPSEEQIEALEHFVRSIGESGFASPYDNNTKLLYSLLSDLKKLKE